MSNRICGVCRSTEIRDNGEMGFACKSCGHEGLQKDFPCMTVFDRLMQSPEVLAPYLVFFSARDKGWCSMLTADSYDTYKDALAATVARLKEVEK